MMDITVDVFKTELSKIVTGHRERFQQAYDAMLEAYTEASEKYRQDHAEYTQKVADKTNTEDDQEPEAPPKPSDRTQTYNLVLQMLEMQVGTMIALDMESFDCLVNDKWSWRHNVRGDLQYWVKYYSDGFDADSLQDAWANSTSTSTSTSSKIFYAAGSYGIKL